MAKLRSESLEPDVLLLDPNNFRYHDSDGFVYAAEDRFHEDSVQQRAFQRLQRDGIQELKQSIMQSGYIPVEGLVVRPYQHGDKTSYVVIEGNRRLAAIRWILEDVDAGVHVKDEVLESLQKLPVLIAEEEGPDEVFRASLMGIRHVSSIKQWGGYQRAKLIVDMRDRMGLEATEAADRLGLSVHEVNRRYRAFKALQQMLDDEEYGAYAGPLMYPIFHEAVSLPAVKEWLAWNDEAYEFADADALQRFYDLLIPLFTEDGTEAEPAKITTRAEVRDLRDILPNAEAKKVLLDPRQSFQSALAIAKREEISRLWATEITEALNSLQSLGIRDLKSFTDDDLELLRKLQAVVAERLEDYEALSKPA